MLRGVTVWPRILSGATMIRAGWFTPGQDGDLPHSRPARWQGRQLVNWLAEIAMPAAQGTRLESQRGDVADFVHIFENWRFDWLDVPAFIRAAELILEFPMIDQEPLPFWTTRTRDAAGRCRAPDVSSRIERGWTSYPGC